MFKGKLYKINTIDQLPPAEENTPSGKYSVTLTLDRSHEIFKGHFPGSPILPGVCQVEMVRELAEGILGFELLLSRASQVKFLNLINPLISEVLQMNLKFIEQDSGEFDVSAEVTSADNVFMKMKGRLTEFKT